MASASFSRNEYLVSGITEWSTEIGHVLIQIKASHRLRPQCRILKLSIYIFVLLVVPLRHFDVLAL